MSHPEGNKEWPMWVLSPEDIEGVAKERGISCLGKDFDEIARVTKKGIEAALCDVWEIAIEGALRYTKAEWQFNIVDIGLTDTSEFCSDREQSLTEKWIGEIGCKADRYHLPSPLNSSIKRVQRTAAVTGQISQASSTRGLMKPSGMTFAQPWKSSY
jgi:hypothetical protein